MPLVCFEMALVGVDGADELGVICASPRSDFVRDRTPGKRFVENLDFRFSTGGAATCCAGFVVVDEARGESLFAGR